MEFNIDIILESIFNKEEQNLWDPSKIIHDIEKIKGQYILDLKQFISETNFDLDSLEQQSQELCSLGDTLMTDLVKCKEEAEKTLPEVSSALQEHKKLTQELSTLEYSLNLINYVINCGKYIYHYKRGRKNNDLHKCMDSINDLYKIIKKPPEGADELDIHVSIMSECEEAQKELSLEIEKTFDSYINWSSEVIDHVKHIKLNIMFQSDGDSSRAIHNIFLFGSFDSKFGTFSKFLMNDILKPMLVQDCIFTYDGNTFDFIIQPKSGNYKPNYKDVITKLTELFSLLSLKLTCHNVTKNSTLMTYLGRHIGALFAEAIMQDCLLDTIPNTVEDMKNYGEVTDRVQGFQKYLENIGFFPPNLGLSILKYTDQLEELFSEHFSQYFLEKARSIMYKDLSVTMSIGVEKIPEEVEKINSVDPETKEQLQIVENEIPHSLFYFPRCMISKSVQELQDLVYMMLEQAEQCSEAICDKLYWTTRLVFELYDAVVPYHHENYLQTIPQYVALFHNNCMYLAHNLQTLGDKWVTATEGRDLDAMSFVDLVPKLQYLGQHHLAVHMQQQRKQILDNIRASDLNSMSVIDLLSPNAEQAIRQCLRQVQVLKNVWIGVFPPNIFVRLIAALLSVFVEELIQRVCSVEDLSAAMCSQLVEIFTIALNKAPKCFQNNSDIEEHVKSWPKFCELVVILSASLKEIEARWKDNGPISKTFTIPELRGLVKAIFQNNQFRANFLAKLK